MRFRQRTADMAKPATQLIKMVSTADTGYFYVAKKNTRTMTEKLEMRKYDPVARKHDVFKESKTKCAGPSTLPKCRTAVPWGRPVRFGGSDRTSVLEGTSVEGSEMTK